MKKTDIKKEMLKLIESLSEYQFSLVVAYIQGLRDEKRHREEAYQAWIDSVPEEEEELNDEYKRCLEEKIRACKESRLYSFEKVAEELGL